MFLSERIIKALSIPDLRLLLSPWWHFFTYVYVSSIQTSYLVLTILTSLFFIRTSCQSALSNIYNCFYIQCEPVYEALRLQNTALQIALLMIRMLFCEKELLYKLNCSILDVHLLLSSLCTCVTWQALLYDPELRYNGSICSVVYIQRLTFHNQTSQTLSYKWVIVINLW